MPTGELISVSQHSQTTYRPGCDYVNGVVFERSLPARKLADFQRPSFADPLTPQAPTESTLFRTENPEIVVPLDAVFEL
jgi:hypothetical protein